MKTFHVHVAVDDIAASVRFYSTLFAIEPSVRKDDYAKWMLDDPRVNFAISARRGARGVDHLGFQVDSDEELEAMHGQLVEADAAIIAEKAATCCYARSDKYWITDPAGVAWETFHTLGTAPLYGSDSRRVSDCSPSEQTTATGVACCAPAQSDAHATCCGPAEAADAKTRCCS